MRTALLTIAGVASLAASLSCSEGSGVRAGGTLGTTLEVAARDPVDFGPVPDFRLTAQDGTPVTRETLAARPWVAAAIFSTCAGPCPRISANMRRLQDALVDTDARLVSVTVDPARDSAAVLAEYARAYGAEPERWLFLTGTQDEVEAFVRGVMVLAVDKNAAGEVTHSTRLVVVDGQGLRRGWYEGQDEASVEAIAARVSFLQAHGR